MSTDERSNSWETVTPGQHLNIALVQIDITFHSRLAEEFSDEMESVSEFVRNYFYSIADLHQGKILSWEGNTGAFIFRVDGDSRYDNCCLAAIEMLKAVPSLNQDIQGSTALDGAIEVSISCDTGLFIFDVAPSQDPNGFANKLIQHRRQVSAANCVMITERIYGQITDSFKARFVPWKNSPELEVALYSTSPLQDDKMPRKSDSQTEEALPGDEPTKPAKPRKRARQAPKAPVSASEPARPRSRSAGRWKSITAALLIVILLAAVIFQANILSQRPAPPPGDELVNSPEWRVWRNHVHEKLSDETLTEHETEEVLIEVLQNNRPPSRSAFPPAVLRHDAAIAEVLLSYKSVADVLRLRLGIYQDSFLGTGLSIAVTAQDYGSASVHEYLVPNIADNKSSIWMRRIDPVGPEFQQEISEFVKQDPNPDAKNAKLRDQIIQFMSEKSRGNSPSALIRFERLDSEQYDRSKTLGRPEARRVFASDLAEVWNLKLKDAATASGYQLKSQGDTFFVWIFLPPSPQDAILATWTNVLENLPVWLQGEGN